MASWSQDHQYVEPKESNTVGKTSPATQPAQGSYSVEEEAYICKGVGDNKPIKTTISFLLRGDAYLQHSR